MRLVKAIQLTFILFLFVFQACEKEDNTPNTSDPSANFTDEYIAEHKGKYFIEIPEVYELAHVVMAVKYQNSNKNYFIKKNTSYFNELLAHFNQHKNSVIFDKFNYSETDFSENYSFRSNSYAYSLDNKHINSKGIYSDIWSPDIFKTLKNDVESFALESDFNSFYQAHLDFYQAQISLYDTHIPTDDIWQWLEAQFSARYDCYKILISPLTTGSHNTNRFETPEYKETVMFVSGLHEETSSSDTLDIALHTRYIFTEIDHNYVNPVSDEYRNEIKKSMSDLNTWRKRNQINGLYDNAYKIFNEYMTWAVYDLYMLEKYPESTFGNIRQTTIKKMEDSRGFIKFQEFEDHLINLYKNKADTKRIEDLYPQILQWIKENDKNS